MAYSQKNNPFQKTSCGRRRNYMTVGNSSPVMKQIPILADQAYTKDNKEELAGSVAQKRKRKPDVRKTTKGKGRNFRTTKEGAGMTSKGVKAYRAKNPGSKLKTAVTGKVKKGSKAAKRRKSFCARSKGWTGERGRAARRRWKC